MIPNYPKKLSGNPQNFLPWEQDTIDTSNYSQ